MAHDHDADPESLAQAFRRFRFPDRPPPTLPEGGLDEQPEILSQPPALVQAFDWRTVIAMAAPSHQGTCNAYSLCHRGDNRSALADRAIRWIRSVSLPDSRTPVSVTLGVRRPERSP